MIRSKTVSRIEPRATRAINPMITDGSNRIHRSRWLRAVEKSVLTEFACISADIRVAPPPANAGRVGEKKIGPEVGVRPQFCDTLWSTRVRGLPWGGVGGLLA